MVVLERLRHPLAAVALALFLTVPWVTIALAGVVELLGTGLIVLIAGLAVLGASFLLAWAAESAEKDVPRAFAIAVLAVLAVAPEYAVDALYAWHAGTGGATAEACRGLSAAAIETGDSPIAEACHDANLAVANMTGANRILIGLGWSGIALFTVYRAASSADPAVQRRDGFLASCVTLDPNISTEITFLALATLWAFLVPLSGGIDLVDMIVLVGIYVVYIAIIIQGEIDPHEGQVGVPAYVQGFTRRMRIPVVLALFVYSGLLIFTAVEPFAHGLEELGQSFGIPAFFMIQWIAPLASESPELIVVAYLVNKARSTAGFNALISSKLNQWTLLIGTLVVVYSLGLGRYGTLPFDARQAAEIWITAAQSYFALAVLVNFNISIREAATLLVLFISQVVIEFLIIRDFVAFPFDSYELLIGYTIVYMLIGTALFVHRRDAIRQLVRRVWAEVRAAFGEGAPPSVDD